MISLSFFQSLSKSRWSKYKLKNGGMSDEGHVNSAYEMFPEKGQDISPAKVKVNLPDQEMPADYCYSGKGTIYSSKNSIGPLSAHQLNAIGMTFCWQANADQYRPTN